MIALERIQKSVRKHRVDEFLRSHFTAIAKMGGVWSLAHALLTAGHDDVAVAVEYRLVAHRHRADSGTAQLVDRYCGAFGRNALH